MGWKLNFSNLGPLARKVKPLKAPDLKSGRGSSKVGASWKGDFSNLGPLAVKVKPMKFKY